MRALAVVLSSFFFWLIAAMAAMAAMAARPAHAEPPIAVSASAGRFSVWRGPARYATYEAGWELRFAPRRLRWLPEWVPPLSPAAGAMATARGALYAYGGFRFDQPLGKEWSVSPQLAAGLYYRDAGRNLGGALEFRSGIELSRRIGERSRLGLTLYHLSNAGLYNVNPGMESLVLTYTARP